MRPDRRGQSTWMEEDTMTLSLQLDHHRPDTLHHAVHMLIQENGTLLARIEELERKVDELERRQAEHRQQHLLW